jgi:hypothetical protein
MFSLRHFFQFISGVFTYEKEAGAGIEPVIPPMSFKPA